MRLGIIGLAASGKTSLFNALTGQNHPVGYSTGAGGLDPRSAVVDIPDPRLMKLSELYQPQKTTPVQVNYSDVGGLQVGLGREGLPGQYVNVLTPMDALIHVLRAFEDPQIPHPAGSVDVARDWAALETEFILNDMLRVEQRLLKLKEQRGKGGGDRASIDRELDTLGSASSWLAEERPLREMALNTPEYSNLAGLGLLSLKPLLAVVNLGEAESVPSFEAGVEVIPIQGKLEMEIAQLDPLEAQIFLREYGLEKPARESIMWASFDLLNLRTFFTVSEEEVRAWTLHGGGTAIEAAGMVHSDMARGFIRAEVIAWDQLLEVGGLSRARTEGKLRLEGKDYPVQDGEVLYIRFNI